MTTKPFILVLSRCRGRTADAPLSSRLSGVPGATHCSLFWDHELEQLSMLAVSHWPDQSFSFTFHRRTLQFQILAEMHRCWQIPWQIHAWDNTNFFTPVQQTSTSAIVSNTIHKPSFRYCWHFSISFGSKISSEWPLIVKKLGNRSCCFG